VMHAPKRTFPPRIGQPAVEEGASRAAQIKFRTDRT
jgi:hypothetical protein